MSKQFALNVQVLGVPETLLKLKGATVVAGRAMARSMYVEGEKIMAMSKSQYVPVKSGNLRNSGHVVPPKAIGKHVWLIQLGFGGPSVAYAVVQHEALHYRHRHGEAKYLEKPALRRGQGMGARVGKDVRIALTKLGRSRGKVV